MESSLSVENRVIVRIWNSCLNGGENVGHISVQTPNHYISLWPAGHPSGKIMQFFENRSHNLLEEVKGDEKLEERSAEITICLYNLNVTNMENKFGEFKNNLQGWTLLGGNRFMNNGSESCASLACYILKAGGLQLDDVTFSSSITPDKMAESVINAKKIELKMHPETVGFTFMGETNVNEISYEKSTCLVM